MASKVKEEKPKVGDVRWDPIVESKKHAKLIAELEEATGAPHHLMLGDSVTLGMFCDSGFSDRQAIDRKHKVFIRKKIETSFGCSLPEELFSEPFSKACEYISSHRTNTPIKKDDSRFLGIKGLKELATGDFWNLSHPFTLKNHVEYFEGWIHGKAVPLNGDSAKDIMEDFESMKAQVFNEPQSPAWEIRTEEGDILKFKNLYQVSCWIIARANNYNPDAMTKENW